MLFYMNYSKLDSSFRCVCVSVPQKNRLGGAAQLFQPVIMTESVVFWQLHFNRVQSELF